MSDSAILFRLAVQIDEQAAIARACAQRLGMAGEQVRWHSSAAGLFRARASASAAGLHRAAAGIERAAGALRSHARTVRHIEQLAEVAERAGREVADGAQHLGHVLREWI